MKVELVPWKKLEIRTYLRFASPEEFASHVAAPAPVAMTGGSTTLLWADGVLFRHVPLNPPTEAIANEQLHGNIVWDHLDFALMPKFASEIKAPNRPTLTISLLDVSGNALFAEVARWAKDQAKRRKDQR
jgi:hypothetical protein